MNRQDGMMEKKMSSNRNVKSKSSRQPWTVGPREWSLEQNSLLGRTILEKFQPDIKEELVTEWN